MFLNNELLLVILVSLVVKMNMLNSRFILEHFLAHLNPLKEIRL